MGKWSNYVIVTPFICFNFSNKKRLRDWKSLQWKCGEEKEKRKLEIDVVHTWCTCWETKYQLKLIQQRIPDSAQPVHLPFWKNHSVTNLSSILHSGILNTINYLSPHEKADPLLSWVSKFSTLWWYWNT